MDLELDLDSDLSSVHLTGWVFGLECDLEVHFQTDLLVAFGLDLAFDLEVGFGLELAAVVESVVQKCNQQVLSLVAEFVADLLV